MQKKLFEDLPIVKKAIGSINQTIPFNTIGIHGVLYDISSINHPGGDLFIKLAAGTDATSLFETHHLNSNIANKYLQTLLKKGTYTQIEKYDYTEYNQFKTIMFRKFPDKKSRRMTNYGFFILLLFFSAWFIIHTLLVLSKFDKFWFPLCMISSFLNSICGGYAHNALHSLSPISIFLDWNGLSCYEWLLEHLQSHHMNVNTIYDHDSISMEPLLNWLPNRPTTTFNINKVIIKNAIFTISEIVVAFNGNFVHKARWKILFRKGFPIWMKLAPFFFCIRIFTHIYFQGFYLGLVTFFTTLCTAGYMFSYLAHLNHTFGSDERPNFLRHQLANTNDINSFFKGPLILFLDRQTIHHLFPSIDHTRVFSVNGKAITELNKKLNNVFKTF